MSKADAEKIAEKTVRNPALTLLAMTTPETFYETVGSAAARDGFLNRFLIVETDIGRQPGRPVQSVEVPQAIIDWAARHAHSEGLVDVQNPSLTPEMTVIPFSPDAHEAFIRFEAECIERMDEYEAHALAEMFGRSNEIAMRVSLLLAVASDATTITASMAEQSIDYVRSHGLRVAERLKTAVYDSEFEAVSNQVLVLIRESGPHGITDRELHQRSRKFRGLDKRGRLNVLASLEYAEEIAKAEFPSISGRGRSRVAWIAVDVDRGVLPPSH